MESEKIIKSGRDVCIETTDKSIYESIFKLLAEKLKEASDEIPPRCIIIVPTIQECVDIASHFKTQLKSHRLRTVILHDKGKTVEQRIDLFEGADIVIGNAKRIQEMYFQNGLNFKNVQVLLILEADSVLKINQMHTFQRIEESLPKCQKIITYLVETEKVCTLVDHLCINPTFISTND